MEFPDRPCKDSDIGDRSCREVNSWIEELKSWLKWLLEGESTGNKEGILYSHNCEKALDGCSNDCTSCMLPELVELILEKFKNDQ